MMRGGRWAIASVAVTLATLSGGCDKKNKADLSKDEVSALMAKYEKARAEEAKRLGAESSARPQAGTPPSSAPVGAAPAAPSGAKAPERPAPSAATTTIVEPRARVTPEGPWIADEPEPIAPAGPITATPEGVVLRSKTDQVFVARLSRLSRSPKPGATPIAKIPKSAGTFPLGPGAGVFEGFAYWISDGKLRRRKLPTPGKPAGRLETLADDARTGARTATPIDVPGITPEPIPQTVAYLVRPDPPKPGAPPDPGHAPSMKAKLWTEGAEPLVLTPEGTATHAVRLVRERTGLLVLSMHARMAMTPVHARPITFTGGKPSLGKDLVVWVGGGVQSHTELTLLPGPGSGLWGFVPHEKSITDFGIAELDIGQRPDEDTPTRWLFYPNGIDPAPLDVGYLCGEPVLVHSQPTTAEPDSPQQLVLRSLTDSAGKAQELARAEAFYSISYSQVPGGGVVAWVADWVTWARTVRCRKP
jgi:hypothetical protein